MKKVIFFTSLSALFLTLFQTAVLSHISVFQVLPDMILALLLYVALLNGSLTGIISGFICGLLVDFLSLAPLGLHSFIFTLLAFIAGKFYGVYNLNKIVLPCLIGSAAFILKVIILFALNFVFGKNIHLYDVFTIKFLIEFIVNILFTPVIFLFLSLFPSAFIAKDSVLL